MMEIPSIAPNGNCFHLPLAYLVALLLYKEKVRVKKNESHRKKTIGQKCLIGRSVPERDAQEQKK